MATDASAAAGKDVSLGALRKLQVTLVNRPTCGNLCTSVHIGGGAGYVVTSTRLNGTK